MTTTTLIIWLLASISGILLSLLIILAFAYYKLYLKHIYNISTSASLDNEIDQNTGLPNRKRMFAELRQLLSEYSDSRIALLFIDIDDFKNINDALGPSIGDKLLYNIGLRLKGELRDLSDKIYHLGADEFAVLLINCGDSTRQISNTASNVARIIGQPYIIQEYEVIVTCAIGICIYPDFAGDVEKLVQHADAARYDAKRLGQGMYAYYSHDMSEKALVRTLLNADLRKAIQRNELLLHYQPKVALATNEVVGAEALLRWQHPTLGFVNPSVFIPIAEEFGLINEIGEWVIKNVCRDLSRLHRSGMPKLHIALNLSSQQFHTGDVAGTIAEALWETDINPKYLEIELTESVVMNDLNKSLLMLRVLASMGIHIAVDDFGTGYSTLNQLKKFPIHTLKIDRTFIQDIHNVEENKVIVTNIVNMAQQLGLIVVAEGVEVIEELEFLRQINCSVVQGYYFSKPIKFEDFAKFVQDANMRAG